MKYPEARNRVLFYSLMFDTLNKAFGSVLTNANVHSQVLCATRTTIIRPNRGSLFRKKKHNLTQRTEHEELKNCTYRKKVIKWEIQQETLIQGASSCSQMFSTLVFFFVLCTDFCSYSVKCRWISDLTLRFLIMKVLPVCTLRCSTRSKQTQDPPTPSFLHKLRRKIIGVSTSFVSELDCVSVSVLTGFKIRQLWKL